MSSKELSMKDYCSPLPPVWDHNEVSVRLPNCRSLGITLLHLQAAAKPAKQAQKNTSSSKMSINRQFNGHLRAIINMGSYSNTSLRPSYIGKAVELLAKNKAIFLPFGKIISTVVSTTSTEDLDKVPKRSMGLAQTVRAPKCLQLPLQLYVKLIQTHRETLNPYQDVDRHFPE